MTICATTSLVSYGLAANRFRAAWHHITMPGQASVLLWLLAFCSLNAAGTRPVVLGTSRNTTSKVVSQLPSQQSLACPAGIPVLTLPAASQAATIDHDKGFRTMPFVFSRAAQVSWDCDLADNGNWRVQTDGSRLWQLCLQSRDAYSLTIIFSTLRLPLHSSLQIHGGANFQLLGECFSGCQRLTMHSGRGGKGVMTAPIPGNSAVLSYYEPAGSAFTRGQRVSLQVRSVLLGVSPLPFQLEAQPMQLETAPTGATLAAVADAVDKAEVASPSQVATTIENLVNRARGKSKACQPNVNCASDWAQEANAVVLLVAADGSEGVYCTATLINAPRREQYILGANHCLGQTAAADPERYWGVLFDYETRCNTTDPTWPQYQLLQGLDIVWNNEVTDVLLLRLDDEVPEAYNPYYLGWDASTWVQPAGGSVCIHHPRGDAKRIAYTTQALVDGQYLIDDPTHYFATWDKGGMETGSSGAMLIDASTKLGLGVLTGGTESEAGCGGGDDIYGSLHVAWSLGLWQYLGTSLDGNATMAPRQPVPDGPGLIVNPDSVIVNEGSTPAELDVRLSDPPEAGEQLLVNISTTGGSPITVKPLFLVFNEDNWDQVQQIQVYPGNDVRKDGGLSFYVLLQLTSDQNMDFYKRRTIPGVRLDDETPPGTTPNRSIIIGVEEHHPFNGTGTLAAAKAPPQVQLSATTLAQFSAAVPTGGAVYYALYNAMITGLTVQACSTDANLRLVVFSAQGVALWSTAAPCSVGNYDPCRAYEGNNECSGFQNLFLSGTDGAGPYTIVVLSTGGAGGNFSFVVTDNGT